MKTELGPQGQRGKMDGTLRAGLWGARGWGGGEAEAQGRPWEGVADRMVALQKRYVYIPDPVRGTLFGKRNYN